MCLTIIARNIDNRFPLILLFNRDESYERPVKGLHAWENRENIYAGQDELYGGTWLGINKSGKLGLLTTYRHGVQNNEQLRSRGLLVADYLRNVDMPMQYLDKVSLQYKQYRPFNILCGDLTQLRYYSSVYNEIITLDAGLYGLSNAFLDTPWPKLTRAKFLFNEMLVKRGFSVEECFKILSDRFQPPDDQLPYTGISFERERCIAPIHVRNLKDGTCSSSVITIDKDKKVKFYEKAYQHSGDSGHINFITFTIS